MRPGTTHLAVRLVPRDLIDDFDTFTEALQTLTFCPITTALDS